MPDSTSSFSVATTMFVSLAICAIISYGIFYYFKQRIAVIEQSQMEQARIMQAIISRGVLHPHIMQSHPSSQQQSQHQSSQDPQHEHAQWHKEITITQNGLIEVSSDDDDDHDDDDDDSDNASSSSQSHVSEDTSDSDSEELDRDQAKEIKHIQIDSIDGIDIDHMDHNDEVVEADANQKKIISLKHALADDDDDDDDDDQDQHQDQAQDPTPGPDKAAFELKIGYKHKKEPLHLNYGNMSVPALRQMAKERGLGGEDSELQKLKKKDLVQLLQ
jgi:hypothetical protein